MDEEQPKIARINDTLRTNQQVGTLLSILAQSQQFLGREESAGTSVTVHPDAEAAALRTYEAANVKLRDILDDTARWQAADPDASATIERVEQRIGAVHRAQKRLLEEQTRPSMLHNATVRLLDVQGRGLAWVAFVGAPTTDGLVGVGRSPAEALADFDRRFEEELPKQENSEVKKPRISRASKSKTP